ISWRFAQAVALAFDSYATAVARVTADTAWRSTIAMFDWLIRAAQQPDDQDPARPAVPQVKALLDALATDHQSVTPHVWNEALALYRHTELQARGFGAAHNIGRVKATLEALA